MKLAEIPDSGGVRQIVTLAEGDRFYGGAMRRDGRRINRVYPADGSRPVGWNWRVRAVAYMLRGEPVTFLVCSSCVFRGQPMIWENGKLVGQGSKRVAGFVIFPIFSPGMKCMKCERLIKYDVEPGAKFAASQIVDE